MAGYGTPSTALGTSDAGPATIGIAAASWHTEIMDALLEGARRAAADAGCEVTELRVPGSFELPVAAQALARTCDVVVALGVVIRGETPHFEYISAAA